MTRCPKCGSADVKFQLRSAGTVSRSKYYRTGVKRSWFLPASERSYKSNRKQISVGLCQNCGYCWDPGQESPSSSNILIFLSGLFSLIFGSIILFAIAVSETVNYPILQFAEAGMLTVAGGIALVDNRLPDPTEKRWILPGLSGILYLGAILMSVIYAFAVQKSNILDKGDGLLAIFSLISFCRMVHQYLKEKGESPKSASQNTAKARHSAADTEVVVPDDCRIQHRAPSNPEYDELLIDAAHIVLSKQRVGTGMLQRELNIGYLRADRIMQQLNQIGVIEHPEDPQKTYIRVTLKEFEEQIVENV